MSSKGAVYIIHAVDTEGPLYEGLKGCFEQIKEQFGIAMEPTMENIKRLRNKKVDVSGRENALALFVSEERIEKYKESWDQIDKMHETLMSEKWRKKLPDSIGKPYVFSWFCMDHVGFNYNPRRRATGFHHIFDYYLEKLSAYGLKRDRIYWHYHPMSFSRDAHRTGSNYSYSYNLHNEIIARRIIDRGWFPVANRPGGHIESFDISTWLEAWIPFDIANQSMVENRDLINEEKAGRMPGRYGDWRGASTEWEIYHPDLYDYRKKGGLRRWISRCLNVQSRHSNLTEQEIEKAFTAAARGEDTLLSYTNHDFRDMVEETEAVVRKIKSVAQEFPEVEFRWCNAVEGFRSVLKMQKSDPVRLEIKLDGKALRVKCRGGTVWGVQPFLALRTTSGDYLHDNLIINPDGTWTYSFDNDSVLLESVDKIGLAANDPLGNTSVHVFDPKSGEQKFFTHNRGDWLE